MVSTDGFLREQKYPCCPEALYQDFIFQIAVARYKKSPTVHLILHALTSLLALMTFFVPPDAGEKIGLSLAKRVNFSKNFFRRHRTSYNGRFHGSTERTISSDERWRSYFGSNNFYLIFRQF